MSSLQQYFLGITALSLLSSLTAVLPYEQSPTASAIHIVQASSISHDAVLAEINRLRSNPSAYADWLETLRPYYDGIVLRWPGQRPIQTQEGTAALDEAIANLRQTAPLTPLVLADGLSQAAQDHTEDLSLSGRFSSRGSDNSTGEDRIRRYGIYEGSFKELVFEGLNDPAALVATLVIDDGSYQRNYQKTLLRTNFKYVGIDCRPSLRLALCVTNFADVYTETDPGNPLSQPLNHGSLSVLAADFITETNNVRQNPAQYAKKLEALRPYYDGNLVKIPGQSPVETTEGIAALDEAVAALKAAEPVSTLDYSDGLNLAAAEHAQDLSVRNAVGHYGADGRTHMERVGRYGIVPPGNRVGENISFGSPTSAEWHVIQLLVDDNVPDRGHRKTMLNDRYRLTGTACEPHDTFQMVCVAVYASDYEEYQ